MKKPTKISLAIVIIMGILYFFGLHTPFIVNRVKKQITSGLSVNQVMDILNTSRKKPDLCCWQAKGIKDYVCSDPKRCDFPDNQIKLNGTVQEIRLTVLFMGPGFIHNDFHVIFDSAGIVTSISDIKRWD